MRALDPVWGPASESRRSTNPRDSGEQLAVYRDIGGAATVAGDGFTEIGQSRKPLMIGDWPLPAQPAA